MKLREVAEEFRRGAVQGKAILKNEVTIRPGHGYLLRSIQPDEGDVLVLLRVEAVLPDRSVVLIWKLLTRFDTPVAIGPDQQR
jgi:hypothetical protein